MMKIGPIVGARIITDEDNDFSASDPMPDLKGDIAGAAWFIKTVRVTENEDLDFLRFNGDFSSTIKANFCNQLVNVITADGRNKSWASRVAQGSGFINWDYKSRTDKFIYYNPFKYEDLQSVLDNYLAKPEHQNKPIYLDPDKPEVNKDLNNHVEYQPSDYQPFGSIVAPSLSSPVDWNSRQSGVMNFNKQPLFYEPPRYGADFVEPYQSRMGEDHSVEGLKRLFGKTFGLWDWQWNNGGDDDANAVAANGGYYAPKEDSTLTWNLLESVGYCPGDVRPVLVPPSDNPTYNELKSYLQSHNEDLCLIHPLIYNIKLNGQSVDELAVIGLADVLNLDRYDLVGNRDYPVTFKSAGALTLKFNVAVDKEQLPLNSYNVTWGDQRNTAVSGVSLRSRIDEIYPFVLSHSYNYWQIKQNNKPDTLTDGIFCGTDNPAGITLQSNIDKSACAVLLKIKVSDNWGAEASTDNDPILIVVKVREK
jgi:hypothetical protein